MKSSHALIVFVLIGVSGAAVFFWITKQSRGQAGGEQKNDDVISAYNQIEKAFRTGDGNLYLSLQSEEKRKAFKPPLENWLPANSITPLIYVDPQSITLKIPLQCLAIRSSDIPIEISEANSFARLLPYPVTKFKR